MESWGQAGWRLKAQPFGAHLLTASLDLPSGLQEIFYLSPRSLGSLAPVRGGVPVLFPQFNELGPLPKHGLVRTATWQRIKGEAHSSFESNQVLGGASGGGRAARVTTSSQGFKLDLGPDVHPAWPHRAELLLMMQASDSDLVIELEIQNTGDSVFEWTGGLHPYFLVADFGVCALKGLGGERVIDRFHPTLQHQPGGAIVWTGEMFERLFDCRSAVELDIGWATLHLSMTGFDQWMVWNPGEQGALALKDLPPQDWKRFVCVEPVCVSRAQRLAPDERFRGALRISAKPG